MAAFHYKALDKQGTAQKGIIEADSLRVARQKVRDKGLMLVDINALHSEGRKAPVKLKHQALALMTRQLATLIRAKLPVEEALKGVAEQTEKPKPKRIIIRVREKVLEGLSLSHALSEFPQAFPNLYVSTVAAGEQTGRLDVVLNRLADYVETEQKTRQKVQQALIYPSMMVIISFAIITFLLTFVVPKIISVFNTTGQSLPTLTVYLINISDFLKHYGIYTLLVVIAATVGFFRAIAIPHIKSRWHRFLLKVPFVTYMIKTVSTARYSHTLAILSNAGVPILKAMGIASNLINNIAIKEAMETAKDEVKEGRNLASALKKTHAFSPMTLHLIASGESSGELEDMLQYAANTQDDDVSRIIATALTLFEPLIILFMGAVVLFIVLATLLPIFSMDQLVH